MDLVIQLAVYLAGFGKMFGESRYMGTFNDPNQFAFFVFASFLFIQIARRKYGTTAYVVDDVLVLFLTIVSASTGMLIGVTLIYVAKLIIWGFVAGDFSKKLLSTIAAFIIILVVSLVLSPGKIQFPATGVSQVDVTVSRVESKINKFSSDDRVSIYEDRGIDKILYYPQYMLFGAGEGAFYRFEEAISSNELHSTPIALLFYYGFVPFCILICWIVANAKSCNKVTLWLYLPLLIECFTLANQRQALFWMLIVLMAFEGGREITLGQKSALKEQKVRV